MGRQFIVALLALFLVGLPLTVAAQTEEPYSADEQAVRALEEQGRIAVLNGDVEALERLWGEQFMVNNPRNEIAADRDAVLDRIRRGLIRYSKFERRIEAIRIDADIAIVMGSETVVLSGDAAGPGEASHRRYTNIWKRTGTTWQAIARHANVITSK